MVSRFILEELHEKLVAKAGLSQSEAGEVIDAVLADAEIVEAHPLATAVCRDPDDDWILATALAAKADALVTGDKDLLILGRYEAITILNPRGCLAHLRGT